MAKMCLIVDLEKCVGCYNCLAACKDEHVDNAWPPYTDAQQKHGQKWIDVERHERGTAPYTEVCYLPRLCAHCASAPCQRARPDAVFRHADGAVLLDPEKAKGDRSLVGACPYGMISWNEELGTAQKCTMCAHLLDAGWAEPRCVGACPLRALRAVRCDDAELERRVADGTLQPLFDGASRPRVLYKNLYRYTDCFIAGALAYRGEDGEERAAAGAMVELRRDAGLVGKATTDFFGEFKIDRIPKGSGIYELTYRLDGYQPAYQEVAVGEESVCLDVTILTR